MGEVNPGADEVTGERSVFSAASSAAGYLYQARLAVCESLRFVYGESGVELSIERLDDVAFETAGDAVELLQTKHHISKQGDLSDASVDVWKTLRVWAEATKDDPSIPHALASFSSPRAKRRLARRRRSFAPKG